MTTCSLEDLERDLSVLEAEKEGRIQVTYGEMTTEPCHLTEKEVEVMFELT